MIEQAHYHKQDNGQYQRGFNHHASVALGQAPRLPGRMEGEHQ
jgi:hypothetical protein